MAPAAPEEHSKTVFQDWFGGVRRDAVTAAAGVGSRIDWSRRLDLGPRPSAPA